MPKLTIQNIRTAKNQQKLSCLTAYTYPIAKILDPICDMILVGDSLGMCVYGLENTSKTTLGMMIDHGKAVVKACNHAFTIVDIPFGTFENSPEQALKTAQTITQETNCDAVKIETTPAQIPAIHAIAQSGINIMAHIGLLPQQVKTTTGYKYQGRDEETAQTIIKTAKMAEQAGAFAITIEAVPAPLADEITRQISIPTIGIGASKNCDGQVLVIDDILALNPDFQPKFVKNYTNLAEIIEKAAKNFDFEVKNGIFPGEIHLFNKK